MTKKQKKMLTRILIASGFTALLFLLPLREPFKGLLFLIPYAVIGYDILRNAVRGVINRQPFDENFLMAVATVGAFALGEYAEGTAVMLFYQIGELFQSCAVGKSRRSIAALMDIRPDFAVLESDGGSLMQVDPEQVAVGQIIVVKPGERIPLDGVILEGRSAIDTSSLTGESLPRTVGVGDEVIGGCINQSGPLRIRTTKPFGESTVAKILDLVENASARKAVSERFISKFARYYTPAVCLSALLLALLPPLVNTLLLSTDAGWSVWIYRALTFLVISCPCALVISIPLTFFAGIGGAGRAGILVKGSCYLETLAKVRRIAFDKTGTVTEGVFEVTDIVPVGVESETLLTYAALAESDSNHPISKSLRSAYGKPIDRERIKQVREIGGQGVCALIDGKSIAVGNARLMESIGLSLPPCEGIGTVVHVSVDGAYLGHIRIDDRIKPQAATAIASLKKLGIRQTVMLTGDRRQAAEEVAQALGIDRLQADLLPDGKVEAVESLLKEENGGTLAFVGDGINDAPVLARADIGIAMGALGSDAAIEAADVVLMDDDPGKIADAIRISRKCLAIVYENIVFSLGIKLLFLAMSAFGITDMWLAIFADVGVMVLAVLNAVRALSVKNETQKG
ncbi:MAG: cadmium-translocating P-type ATPase [Ruminococcaceae bacterium]|nr:cadmium-translocating P-type ATPase [Oscillospiraceae bacterium]